MGHVSPGCYWLARQVSSDIRMERTFWKINNFPNVILPRLVTSYAVCGWNEHENHAYQKCILPPADSQYNRNVGLMLKLLNVNGYASLLCGSNYTGPKIETTSGSGESVEAFLSDARGPTLPDKKQLVRQVHTLNLWLPNPLPRLEHLKK